MIKFVLFLLVGYFVLKTLKEIFGQGPPTRMETGGRRSDAIDDLMVKDPHCRTYILKRDALQAERNGETYYFCSRQCRDDYLMKL